MKINQLSGLIVKSALTVHSSLGPGLLESAYQACLLQELKLNGLHVDAAVPIAMKYKGIEVEIAYRCDMVVEHQIIVELKAVTKLLPIHSAQLLSYLRLSNIELGLLFNFHEPHLKNGITRLINGWP